MAFQVTSKHNSKAGTFLRWLIPLRGKTSSYRDIKFDADTTRGHWGNKSEFLLSLLGSSVGLGNFWRFPTLAYENGGAAFFIPYIILQTLIGQPLYLLELAIGQYSGKGPTEVYQMNPEAKGVGVSMLIVSSIINVYYPCIMAYALYFMFASIQQKLPWTYCTEEMLDKCCSVRIGGGLSLSTCSENRTNDILCKTNTLCKCSGNLSLDFDPAECPEPVRKAASGASYSQLMKLVTNNCTTLQKCTNNTATPAHYFFYDSVIQQTHQMDNIGLPLWRITICLIVTWIIVLLCVVRGIKSSGKVIYFTVTLPYVILIAMVVQSMNLVGAVDGISYFLIPDWSKLGDVKVWKAAGGQMFFSLSVCQGPLITLASYSTFRNNIYTDALLIGMCDLLTSFLAGLLVFCTLGAMAHDTGIDISVVAHGGMGLAFVVYPEALSMLPAAQVWSFLFFFMLFTLGVDSVFALFETAMTCIVDESPRLAPYKMRLSIVMGMTCLLLALPIMTPGGLHVMNLMDRYMATYTLYVIGLGELIAVAWVYGINNFLNDVETMIGCKPYPVMYWKLSLQVIAPVFLIVILLLSLVHYTPEKLKKGVPLPKWAEIVGWTLCACVLSPIPIYFGLAVCRTKADTFCERLKLASKPAANWGPQKNIHNDALLQMSRNSKRRKESRSKNFNKDITLQEDGSEMDLGQDVPIDEALEDQSKEPKSKLPENKNWSVPNFGLLQMLKNSKQREKSQGKTSNKDMQKDGNKIAPAQDILKDDALADKSKKTKSKLSKNKKRGSQKNVDSGAVLQVMENSKQLKESQGKTPNKDVQKDGNKMALAQNMLKADLLVDKSKKTKSKLSKNKHRGSKNNVQNDALLQIPKNSKQPKEIRSKTSNKDMPKDGNKMAPELNFQKGDALADKSRKTKSKLSNNKSLGSQSNVQNEALLQIPKNSKQSKESQSKTSNKDMQKDGNNMATAQSIPKSDALADKSKKTKSKLSNNMSLGSQNKVQNDALLQIPKNSKQSKESQSKTSNKDKQKDGNKMAPAQSMPKGDALADISKKTKSKLSKNKNRGSQNNVPNLGLLQIMKNSKQPEESRSKTSNKDMQKDGNKMATAQGIPKGDALADEVQKPKSKYTEKKKT